MIIKQSHHHNHNLQQQQQQQQHRHQYHLQQQHHHRHHHHHHHHHPSVPLFYTVDPVSVQHTAMPDVEGSNEVCGFLARGLGFRVYTAFARAQLNLETVHTLLILAEPDLEIRASFSRLKLQNPFA